MKKYFKKQLKNCKLISKELLLKLEGKSLYSNYKIDDKIVYFLFQELGEIKQPYTEPSISLSVKSIVERELDKLKNNYKFIRMGKDFPVLEMKNT